MSAQSGTNDPQVSITPMDQNTMMNMINQLHGQLQAQSSQISSLQQQLSSAHNNVPVNTAIDPALSTGPKKNKPPTFDGKSSTDSWVAHMDSYVQGLSDEQACAIAITYLTKDAHDWYIAFSNSNNSMQSWSILRETIAKRFNPLNKVKLARDKLSRWRQAKDVKTFNADFLRILIDIPRISTDEQLDRYSRGLKPYIWAELCTTDYTNLEDLMRDAERVESAKANRPQDRDRQRTGVMISNTGPIPMELNAVSSAPTRLTPDERDRCIKEGLCLRCREKGHIARHCPKNSQRS
jgi:hypothetical protein